MLDGEEPPNTKGSESWPDDTWIPFDDSRARVIASLLRVTDVEPTDGALSTDSAWSTISCKRCTVFAACAVDARVILGSLIDIVIYPMTLLASGLDSRCVMKLNSQTTSSFDGYWHAKRCAQPIKSVHGCNSDREIYQIFVSKHCSSC